VSQEEKLGKQITIAKAMGYQSPFRGGWIKPGATEDKYTYCSLPDPFEDANDCAELIEWLNADGFWVEIHWQPDKDEFGETMAAGAFVHIWHRDTEQHSRKDFDRERWKECVCEIALEIIESKGGNDSE
jgi:hypothetical protein